MIKVFKSWKEVPKDLLEPYCINQTIWRRALYGIPDINIPVVEYPHGKTNWNKLVK